MKDIFKNDDTFLARWLNGDLNEDELKAFEQSDDFKAYQKIADKSSNLQPIQWDKDKLWKGINSEDESEKGREAKVKKLPFASWLKYAAAASVILVVGYLALFSGDDLVITETYAAEMKTVILPDNSLVHLNAESVLRYDSKAFNQERNLTLDGEAYFEVVKGSTFTVHTSNGDVRVLGTTFNVRSRMNKMAVQCYSGSVGVSVDDFKDRVVLDKGSRVMVLNNELGDKIRTNRELRRPEWKDGRSKFVNAAYSEVINELERQFDIEIKTTGDFQNLGEYNGGFRHDDLNSALQIVFSSINYEFKIDGKTVILSRKD